MAVTETTSSRVLRGVSMDAFGDHAFTAVNDLPQMESGRPGDTGNPVLDAIRHAAWEEGFAAGKLAGAEHGYADGVERGIAEGRAIGHRDGLASARAEALADLRVEASAALAALDAATNDLIQRDAVTLTDIEPMVVDLVLALTESILGRELQVAENPGRDALCRALALAPENDELLARLHPADLEKLGDVVDLAPGRAMRLVADSSVGSGGCVVEAGAARLDARIESALDRVREALQP